MTSYPPVTPGDPAPSDRAEHSSLPARGSEREIVRTLFDLGRRVTSVLDLDELLERLPSLIQRLMVFDAFAVYLLDEPQRVLRIAHAAGYPSEADRTLQLAVGEGLVGTAVQESRAILINDVSTDPRYVELVPGMRSELVVPLRHKARVIGAINILSTGVGQFDAVDEAILRQFAAHVAVAIVNARLFERERRNTETFETLSEIGREVSSILDLDDLLTRIAQLVKRVINYRTFGIFLLNERRDELEVQVAVKYGTTVDVPRIPLGHGLVGFAALHEESVLVADVSKDPRYIPVVKDVRSELAVPMMLKERCIGVIDLESPQLGAFDRQDVEMLTLLASQAAVAIENARLYKTVAANEVRLGREVRFAQRVQRALLPEPPVSPDFEVAGWFSAARELGGDFHDFLTPDQHGLVVAVGDVSGKGVAAALYGAFAGELVRSRTFRRRFDPQRFGPAGVLASLNTILHDRQLEEYYCTLCYASFDFERRAIRLANSGLPYPIRASRDGCAQVKLPGLPLGAFPGSTYDELTLQLEPAEIWVFCTDGIFEAEDPSGQMLGEAAVVEVIRRNVGGTAREVVDSVFEAVRQFQQSERPGDDMTVVAVKVQTG
jgi:sigma-B regulation protein RsbU (phosphoserine phosphatase)